MGPSLKAMDSHYGELLETTERTMMALRLKNVEQEIKILKLRTQLAKVPAHG